MSAPSQPGRVVFVDHTAVLAGGERSLVEVASHLDDWTVQVVLGAEGELTSLLHERKIEHDVVPVTNWSSARALPVLTSIAGAFRLVRWAWRLRRWLGAAEPDVVVANSLKSGIAVWLATMGRDPGFVWALRDRLSDDYMSKPARRAVRWLVGSGPDVVVANSRATADTSPHATTRVIPPSVSPLDVESPQPGPTTTFAVASRLAPWKGQALALEAFAEAFPSSESCPVALRIIGGPLFGEDQYATELSAISNRLGLGDRVSFTGHVADVGAHLHGVDVMLAPSVVPEPFGRTIVEAMSAGISVIASDAGGPSEIIDHEVDGLLVPPGDHEALGRAMRRLVDPSERTRLAAAGRIRAADFEPARLAPDWSQVLTEAASR